MTYYECNCAESCDEVYENDGYCPHCKEKTFPVLRISERSVRRALTKEERDAIIKEENRVKKSYWF